jgi:hypothetical protein
VKHLILQAKKRAAAVAAVGLLSVAAVTTTTHSGAIGLLGRVLDNNSTGTSITTTHLLAHLLQELASLLASNKLELVTTATSDGGRVSGRAVEGDKSFRSRSSHSVLYYLEEKFLGWWGWF